MLLWHLAGWVLEEMDVQRAVSDRSSSFTALLHPPISFGPDCIAVRVLCRILMWTFYWTAAGASQQLKQSAVINARILAAAGL